MQIPAAEAPALRFSGDLRYRHESINEDTVGERHRARLRARFGVDADVTDDVQVGLVLATGGDDPVSANQTLDGGFSRKSIGVDRAFFTWQATEALSFTGGKMATPFFRPGNHHLIYDNDLNPEGLALRYTFGDWFANYAGLWVEERSSANDSILLGGQFGYRGMLDNGSRLTAGMTYYDYLETKARHRSTTARANGNRLDLAGNYLNDFNELELFAELEIDAWPSGRSRCSPTRAEYGRRRRRLGIRARCLLRRGDRPGTWRVGYAYQDLEADAVIATFTDSDFAGGGTDGKGHVIELKYALRDRWTLGFRYFLNERGADAGNEHDYNRLTGRRRLRLLSAAQRRPDGRQPSGAAALNFMAQLGIPRPASGERTKTLPEIVANR